MPPCAVLTIIHGDAVVIILIEVYGNFFLVLMKYSDSRREVIPTISIWKDVMKKKIAISAIIPWLPRLQYAVF